MLGERLRYLRQKNGFTQRKVAEILNIDRSTYTYYETGKTSPDASSLKRLARIFDVSVDYILDNTPPGLSRSDDGYDIWKRNRDTFSLSQNVPLSEKEQSLLLFFRTLDDDKKQLAVESVKNLCSDDK